MDFTDFSLGINYWPQKEAFSLWKKFDAGILKRDFELIKSFGMDCVRIFLVWEDFQPSPNKVSAEKLNYLVTSANIAAEAGLQIIPTFFCGHMSGANFLPSWILGKRVGGGRFPIVSHGHVGLYEIKNFYEDKELQQSQKLLLKEVAAVLKNHPAIKAWDLGNEPSVYITPRTGEGAERWLAEMTGTLRGVDADVPITIGTHMEDLIKDNKIAFEAIGKYCDFLVMHGYTVYSPVAIDIYDRRFILFLVELTKWLGGKRVLLEEFGFPTSVDSAQIKLAKEKGLVLLSDSEGEKTVQFTQDLFEDLYEEGCLGAYWWCFADYDKSAWSKPPLDQRIHERFFGIKRVDGTIKPVASVFKKFGKRLYKDRQLESFWRTQDREDYFSNPEKSFKDLWEKFKNRKD